MSELIKWFEKRKETKAMTTIQRHLALATEIVEDLKKAIKAAVDQDIEEMNKCIERVATSEKEADVLRRKVMDDVSKGDLPPTDREDLMDLVKRVDMIADWSRESTRILGAISMDQTPNVIQKEMMDMVESVKRRTSSLQKCMNKMMTKPDEALQAADAVEREEEKVDDVHEKARMLIGKEDMARAGTVVLISQLFEAIEMIADSCEDACDRVRIIIVRK